MLPVVPPLPIGNVPAESVVPPEYVLSNPKISVPVPVLVRLPAPVMPPAVCVPAPTLNAVPFAKFTAVLLSVEIDAVAPLKLAMPPLAVVILAGPATLIVPLEKVGTVAPAAKLVVPVPL